MGDDFYSLWKRATIVCAVTFGVFNFVLIVDTLIWYFYLRRKEKPNLLLINYDDQKYNLWHYIKRDIRGASLSTLGNYICLMGGTIRRAFTNASNFDIQQMWWHSLVSVIDITILILVNKYLASNTLDDLGFPQFYNKKGWKLSWKKLWRRLLIVLGIVIGTHTITPLLYYFASCFNSMHVFDYSNTSIYQSHGVAGVVYFFFVQQICFFINGVDEESYWRGFTNAIYSKEQTSRVVMYFISGWMYAMDHSLNGGSSNLGSYAMVVMNIVLEGAAWMYLYRSTRDLVGNWLLHDIDDLFSLWFGATSLAGYGLPGGQIAPYKIGCSRVWIDGGDFGTGGSILYLGQDAYTFLYIFLLNKYAKKTLRILTNPRLPNSPSHSFLDSSFTQNEFSVNETTSLVDKKKNLIEKYIETDSSDLQNDSELKKKQK
ncbi:membrane-associated protease-related [Anaeramoeba ignava]|uniref:Membrane-associated protease-related n=1 Tax=Anaeramoeba ignava TaxID=1746090 RepID=A0A9Q0LIQ1_ANAIG|nr:membrane-associated protease-related [Anaeramoeba ignava]